jgi:hypothetical protein
MIRQGKIYTKVNLLKELKEKCYIKIIKYRAQEMHFEKSLFHNHSKGRLKIKW